MSHRKIGSIDPGVCPLIDGNEIQDGGHSGHLGWAAVLIIERNLPLVTPNKPQKNLINRSSRMSYNWWKPNAYGHRRIGHDIMPRHFMIGVHKKPLILEWKITSFEFDYIVKRKFCVVFVLGIKLQVRNLKLVTKVHSQWPVITYLTPGCLIRIAPVHHLYLLLHLWVRLS
jgi:hypothetical protein